MQRDGKAGTRGQGGQDRILLIIGMGGALMGNRRNLCAFRRELMIFKGNAKIMFLLTGKKQFFCIE